MPRVSLARQSCGSGLLTGSTLKALTGYDITPLRDPAGIALDADPLIRAVP